MVDVSFKPVTHRVAVATGSVRVLPATLSRVRRGRVAKGSVLEVARLAGIQAAKRTADLIPLCHPLALSGVVVDLRLAPPRTIEITATVKTADRTGVEMEALTAVSVAALTVYDMLKAIERGITIGPIRLEEKEGGRSGHYRRRGRT